MSQSGYSPISLYYSTTASAAPTAGNLVSGELAVNITDGVLFYKDNAGVVQTLATKAATSGTYTSITITGGTANGVGYLNGSKQFTTGSALTFDGSTFTSTGVQGILSTVGGNSARMIATAAGTYFGSTTAADVIFQQNSSEGMRLTSTGLGIGETSIVSKLAVTGSLPYATVTGSSSGQFGFQIKAGAADSSATLVGGLTYNSSTGENRILGPQSYNFLTMYAGGSERMLLDTSGNLGIGTSSPSYKLDVAGSIAARFANPDVAGIVLQATTGTNAAAMKFANTGGNGYVGLDSSVGNRIGGGAYSLNIWHEAAYPIAFGTNNLLRMTLDSSGNLGIGTSSPGSYSAKLVVNGTISILGGNKLYLWDSTNFYTPALQATGNALAFMGNSGSEQMRLDSSGNLGLGVTPVDSTSFGRALDVGSGTGASVFVRNTADSSYYGYLGYYSTSLFVYNNSSGPIQFGISNSEQMRLTSTGLGIGTSSPYSKLNLAWNSSTGINNGLFGTVNNSAGANNGYRIGLKTASDNTNWAAIDQAFVNLGVDARTYITFSTTDNSNSFAERMRLDSSGNLGLGVTPSAWFASNKALQINTTGVLSSYTNGANIQTFLANNAFWNASGTISYITSNTATSYTQDNGAHKWYYAASGTAGNAITFTQAMTLDASGKLGVGTTSPSRMLDVQGAPSSVGGAGSGVLANFVNTSTAYNASPTAAISLWNKINSGGSPFPSAVIQAGKENSTDGNYAGYLSLQTTDSSGVSTERARIDSSGNFGVGGSPLYGSSGDRSVTAIGSSSASFFVQETGVGAVAQLGVYNGAAYLGTRNSYPVLFTINNAEKARIDSSGNLLVGATSAYGNGLLQINAAGEGIDIRNTSGAARYPLVFENGTTQVGTVTTSTTATSYNTSSDYRLKDNQQPLTGSGAFIDALQPKTWEWKADGSKGVGFIAHEVQAVSPGSVVGEKDAVDEDGKPKYQAMEYGSAEFIANIVAELQSLRKRVAQLEGK